jgi:chaperonin GroES
VWLYLICIFLQDALLKSISLFGDYVLIERLEPVAKTTRSTNVAQKAMQAKVVAVGPGRSENGSVISTQVKTGDLVLLSEYGGLKVIIDKKEYELFRDSDIIGKFN